MNKHGSLLIIDWAVITVRWAFVASASLWLAWNGEDDGFILAILALVGICNVLLSILASASSLNPITRTASVILDFVFIYLLLWFTKGNGSGVQWMAFLPLISAAFYFRWIGALIGILISLLGREALAFPFAFNTNALIGAGTALLAYCLVGLGAATLGTRLQSENRIPSGGRGSFYEKKDKNKRQNSLRACLPAELDAELSDHSGHIA